MGPENSIGKYQKRHSLNKPQDINNLYLNFVFMP